MFIILLIFLIPKDSNEKNIYSPYQLISVIYEEDTVQRVKASNLFFQTPYSLDKLDTSYFLPFKASNEVPKKILIVGSGTGNDTAAAISSGVDSIDAVEIDPVIIDLGKYHPNKPYEDQKVNVIKNDARNFIRHTNEKYDLILYGLLDSHTSLSSNGGIRLDSYVYTVQAFEEAKKKLTKDGYISLTFGVASKKLGIKIFRMLKKAFNDKDPTVYMYVPGAEKLDDKFFVDGDLYKKNFIEAKYTFLISNNANKVFRFNDQSDIAKVNFFDNDEIKVSLSNDDWPFFYMPVKIWPKSYVIILILIFVCSFLFIKKTSTLNRKNFSITCFFLGAGFMLIETKGITEIALIYGSTWFVITIVIGFILLMAYLANLLIIKNGQIKSSIIYFLLIISLLFGYFFTFVDTTIFSSIILKIVVPLILTVPIFFSGLAFSKELSVENHVGVALSSNILGAIFGGLIEYNSMYFGFKSLYLLGIVMYLMGYVFSKENKFKLF